MKTIDFDDYINNKGTQFKEGVAIMTKRLHKKYKNILKDIEPFCGNCATVQECPAVMYKLDDSPCPAWKLSNTKTHHTKVLKTSYKQKYKLLKKHLCVKCEEVYIYDDFNYECGNNCDCEFDECTICCSRKENQKDLRGKFNPNLNKYIK